MEEEKITPTTFPKYTLNPRLEGLSDYVKDPKNYNTIQRTLLESIATTHSHSDVAEWGGCIQCQQQVKDHANTMRKFGFKKASQYREWKKVMNILLDPKNKMLYERIK